MIPVCKGRHFLKESDCTSYDNDALDTFEGDLAAIRTRSDIRQIPRNFLEITHEVIGVGQFGSVMRGTVKSAEGTRDSAIFLIIPCMYEGIT